MTHTITLEVSQDLYDLLAEVGKDKGQSPEVVAADILASARLYLTTDPLERLAGTLETDVRDWGRNHDHYLGQALLAEMRDGHGQDSVGDE